MRSVRQSAKLFFPQDLNLYKLLGCNIWKEGVECLIFSRPLLSTGGGGQEISLRFFGGALGADLRYWGAMPPQFWNCGHPPSPPPLFTPLLGLDARHWFIKAKFCDICGCWQTFICQLYCPLAESSCQRTLYIFACSNRYCWNKDKRWSILKLCWPTALLYSL